MRYMKGVSMLLGGCLLPGQLEETIQELQKSYHIFKVDLMCMQGQGICNMAMGKLVLDEICIKRQTPDINLLQYAEKRLIEATVCFEQIENYYGAAISQDLLGEIKVQKKEDSSNEQSGYRHFIELHQESVVVGDMDRVQGAEYTVLFDVPLKVQQVSGKGESHKDVPLPRASKIESEDDSLGSVIEKAQRRKTIIEELNEQGENEKALFQAILERESEIRMPVKAIMDHDSGY